MAFEVSNGHDTEDYEDLYTITCLSFRPQGDFSGPPGWAAAVWYYP